MERRPSPARQTVVRRRSSPTRSWMRALLPALVGAAAFVVPFELVAEEPGGASTTGAKAEAEPTAEPPGDLGHKEAQVPAPRPFAPEEQAPPAQPAQAPTIVEKPAQPVPAPAAAQAAAPSDLATFATKDEIEEAGYLPGYRAYPSLG